jgi:UDP-glucose 4-epimerase
MRVLVTGGAGFIGSNLVEELVKNNTVTVVDNLSSGSLNNLKSAKDKICFINDECKNLGHLWSHGHDFDVIFHLGIPSASPMYKENKTLVGNSINDMIHVMEFAKTGSTKKVIYASSSSLYNGLPPPHAEDMKINVTDYYTEARLGIERIAELYYKLYGVKSVGLRLFSVYGMHEEAKGKYANIITQFMWDMKKGKQPTIFGDGKQYRDFTFVKDVVKAFVFMMDRDIGCEVYNVGSGSVSDFNTVVGLLNCMMGTDIKPTYIKNPIQNYVHQTHADTRKIYRLGYEPDYTLERGLDELLNGG